jgi:hypothetical protein
MKQSQLRRWVLEIKTKKKRKKKKKVIHLCKLEEKKLFRKNPSKLALEIWASMF